jgi:hypothetical protein
MNQFFQTKQNINKRFLLSEDLIFRQSFSFSLERIVGASSKLHLLEQTIALFAHANIVHRAIAMH